MTQERRAFFRLAYPSSDRPTIEIKGAAMRVINISEQGCLFIAGKIYAEVGQEVEATIFFAETPPVEVKGRVIRIDQGKIAVLLVDGISEEQIIREQNRLKEKYPEGS